MKKIFWPKSIFCNFKNGQKSIFGLGKSAQNAISRKIKLIYLISRVFFCLNFFKFSHTVFRVPDPSLLKMHCTNLSSSVRQTFFLEIEPMLLRVSKASRPWNWVEDFNLQVNMRPASMGLSSIRISWCQCGYPFSMLRESINKRAN